MKLILKDSDMAIVDHIFEPEVFKKFWAYFNQLDFAYRSMTGWCKVWRINDGQVLAGAPHYHKRAPFNTPLDWLHKTILALVDNYVSDIVGKEGEDWNDILLTPYIYPAGTKISWHDDFSYSGACIFYPHLEWNQHWGGELLVAKGPPKEEYAKIKEETKDFENMTRDYVLPVLNYYGMGRYVAPLPNRMVFTKGEVWHAINRVDQAAGDHMRCSIVAFFTKQEPLSV